MTKHQKGVALVLVLWVITLLAVIAGNFAFSMRGEAQIARNLLSTSQAKAMAEAGVQIAWLETLKSSSDAKRWRADGQPHEIALDGVLLRISLQDESGKIDLNTASEPLLKGLFRSAGMDEDASVALLDAVLDWRDADRLRRIHGAEEDDYRAAGKSYVPSNAAFKTVDELLRVVGMTPELYRMLSPALTVYSKLPGINSAFASRKVLLAIPGVNTGAIEQYLIQRQSLTDSGQAVPAFSEAGAFASAISGQGAYSVRSEAAMADGTVFVREAVAKVTPDPRHPVTVLAWGEGDAEQLTGK